jgi:hypothetical protein
MNKKEITKTIACPECGKIVKCQGVPGEKIIVICPECNIKGYYQFPEVKKEKIEERIKHRLSSQLPHIIVIISISFSYFIFQTENLAIFLSFFILIPIFVFFQFDGRIPIGYSMLMLALSALALTFYKDESFANLFAIYAYWLLVVGTTCLLIEYLREQRKSNRRKLSG